MDFITKLPRTVRRVDSIWVIMDRLTKSMNFIKIQESSFAEKLADIYIWEVVAHYGVPVFVLSNRDVQFTSRFWKRFHEELGTRLHFSMTFTRKWMVRVSITFRQWRIFSLTTVIMPTSIYLLLRCSMGGSVGPPLFWGEVGQWVMGSTEVVLKTNKMIQQVRGRL